MAHLNAGTISYKPLNGTKWDSLDRGAKVILKSLLNLRPNCRLTAAKLLTRPWLYTAQGQPYPSALSKYRVMQADRAGVPPYYEPGPAAIDADTAAHCSDTEIDSASAGSSSLSSGQDTSDSDEPSLISTSREPSCARDNQNASTFADMIMAEVSTAGRAAPSATSLL